MCLVVGFGVNGEGGLSRCGTEGKVDCIDGRGLCIVKHKSVFATWSDLLDKKIHVPYVEKPKLKIGGKKKSHEIL